MSALYKDVHQLVGNILTILFFATPVVYSFDDMPAKIQNLLLLNPVAQFFRISTDLVFWGKTPHGSAISIALLMLIITQFLAVFATSWFRRRLAESL
jgi:ABC-type polysaccharide/polyol phosphate export permease